MPRSLRVACSILIAAFTLAAGAQEPARSREEAERLGHLPLETLPDEPAPAFVLRGGVVLTAAGQRLEPGFVVVEQGRITQVGAGDPPQVPAARVIDVSGKFITPGLIDAHSHLGVYPSPGFTAHDDGNEATAPVTAGVWAEHSLWPQDPGIELAVAGGVTTMLVLPGSANLVGGRGVTVHLVPARGSRAMRFPGAPDVVKMACGENPKRVYGGKSAAPSTRMGNLRGQREAFFAAQRYRDDWRRWREKAERKEKSPPKKSRQGGAEDPELPPPPARDLGLETLAEVLDGQVLVEWHCYRADDMLDALQLAEEAGFHVRAFHHALEAYKIRDILAAEGVAVATWSDWWGFKIEAYDGIPENAALVAEAGGRAVIKSDSAIDIQRLNQEAGKVLASARAAGVALDENGALRMVTANPAWALGIDGEVGTLEPGKRADLVVWDAYPFSVYAHAQHVFVDGRLRYDRAREGKPWSDYSVGQEGAP